MISVPIAILFYISAILDLSAKDLNEWDVWDKELNRQCPSDHLNWVSDADYDDMLYDFEQTLPKKIKHEVQVTSRLDKCPGQSLGFYCEMGVSLVAYIKLGLIKRFVTFECRHYHCDDIAMCTKTGLPRD